MSAFIRRLASLILGFLLIGFASGSYLLLLGTRSVPPVRTRFFSLHVQPGLVHGIDFLVVMAAAAGTIMVGLVFVWASFAWKRKRSAARMSEREDAVQALSLSRT